MIAFLYAVGLYYRDKRIKENKSWLPYLLSALRFASVLGILFLLLTPLIRHLVTEQLNPSIVIVSDQSGSIYSDDQLDSSSYKSSVDLLRTELGDEYEIQDIVFGANMAFNKEDSIDGSSSNLSAPLEYVSETFEDQNLGAVVLFSDGLFNEGKNPLYADIALSAPLYTVALGDTTIQTDLLIKNALHNRIVYLNDRMVIEADIQAYNSGGAKSNLVLYKVKGSRRTELGRVDVNIDSDNYFNTYSFEIDADEAGNIKYQLALRTINNEISTQNNYRNIYIDVLDARQNVILLARAPHPDIKALKSIIERNKNYNVEVGMIDSWAENIQNFDIVVLHDLPAVGKDASRILDAIQNEKIPCIYILGANTSLTELEDAQSVFTVSGSQPNLNNVTPVVNPDFNLFTLSDNLKSRVKNFVPLKSKFGNYAPLANSEVLLYQKIGNVETGYPLIAFSDQNDHKQAVITGEGIWRWRLIEYAENQNDDITSELISKSLQYVSIKEDKRPFRAFSNKRQYKENEDIVFDAQLYNASFEPVNTPEANITVRDSDGNAYEFTFAKTNDYYTLDAGRFSEGQYTFVARTNYNGQAYTSSGQFNVETIVLEQYDLTAKHDVLTALSQKHNGSLFYLDQVESLVDSIQARSDIKPIVFQKVETERLLNLKWLLMIFIALLALEWFLRRYFGGY